MSQTRSVKYTCPYCSKEIDVTVYDSVNVSQDPDLKDRAMSGDLFHVNCPHCFKEFMVQYVMLYIDMDKKFIIWLNDDPTGTELMAENVRPFIEAGFRIRRCETISEFVEKLQIFEDGLDDVMVELARYDCFIEFVNNKKGNVEDITSIEYQTCENEVMKINVRTGDKGMAFMIPISFMEEEMKGHGDFYSVDNSVFPAVNAKWMGEKFEELAKKMDLEKE